MSRSEEAAARNLLCAKVRHRAMSELVERHWDEFTTILTEHRAEVGLPPAKERRRTNAEAAS